MTVRTQLRPIAIALATAMLLPLLALIVTAAPAGASEPKLIVRGGGWGHGVGMSQYGAEGMARQGRTATQILQHYYRGTTVGSAGPWSIDVLIGAGRSAVTIRPQANTTLYYQLPGGTRQTFGTVGANDVVLVNTNGIGSALFLKVNGSPSVAPGWPAGTKVWMAVPSARVKIQPANRSDFLGWTGAESDREYRWGTLELSAGAGTTEETCKAALCTVIRDMNMEHYLRGIAESLGSFSPAAQQAQAITARTFAARKVAAPRDGLYDIRADVSDQYYRGWGQESTSAWISAVSATPGHVLLYGTSLAETFYSSSSGGHTENSENVFLESRPYLKGVPDPTDSISPHHSWSREYTLRDIGQCFGVANVRDVRVVGPVGVSGRIDKATVQVVGSTTRSFLGSATGSNPGFRQRLASCFPSNQLMSTKVTFAVTSFPDVPPNSYYAAPVRWLTDEGITTGVGDTGLYKPHEAVSRAQMVTFLWRMMGSPTGFPGHGFADVPGNSYYDAAVRWAKARGITTGVGGTNRFAPNEVVNRAQMSVFLHRTAGLKAPTARHGFPDVPRASYYDAAVSWASQHRITTGVGDTGLYKPLDAVTRGQMAAFLHRTASTDAAWAGARPPTAP